MSSPGFAGVILPTQTLGRIFFEFPRKTSIHFSKLEFFSFQCSRAPIFHDDLRYLDVIFLRILKVYHPYPLDQGKPTPFGGGEGNPAPFPYVDGEIRLEFQLLGAPKK